MDLARADTGPVPIPRLFREIFLGNVDRVYAILRFRGVPRDQRDDVVHEVFARVQERWGQCKTRSAPEKWINEIARNVARDRQRAICEEEKVIDRIADLTIVAERVAAPDVPSEADAIEAERHEAARLDRVRRLLQEIDNPDWREVVTRRIEGQTNPEIAAALGVPLPTVGTWYRRGRGKLLAAHARDEAREHHERRAGKLALVFPIFGTRSLFEGVLDDVKAPESLRERVWERLQALPEHGGGGGGPAAPAMPPAAPMAALAPSAAASWGLVLFGVACAALLLAIGVVIGLLLDPHRSHAAPVELGPDVAAVATSTASAAPIWAPAPSTAPSSAPLAPRERASTAPAPSSAPVEHDLLDDAQRALLAGDVAGALRAIDEHARLFPHGQRAEVRERLRIDALLAAGPSRRAEATARLDRFAAAHPNNSQADRFRAQLRAP
jgi:RNA polymerase sigma factor (sigma-70 family)